MTARLTAPTRSRTSHDIKMDSNPSPNENQGSEYTICNIAIFCNRILVNNDCSLVIMNLNRYSTDNLDRNN